MSRALRWASPAPRAALLSLRDRAALVVREKRVSSLRASIADASPDTPAIVLVCEGTDDWSRADVYGDDRDVTVLKAPSTRRYSSRLWAEYVAIPEMLGARHGSASNPGAQPRMKTAESAEIGADAH